MMNGSQSNILRLQQSNAKHPTIVILGGTGMLGHKLFQQLRQQWSRTICAVHPRKADPLLSRIPLFQNEAVIDGLDVSDFDRLAGLLREIQPDFVVNCVGLIKQREGASSPVPTITLNALLPHQLAELAAVWGGRVIHFSTDCVFSGMRGNYQETDPSDASDLYGRTKYLGETVEPNALTIRTSIIGRELANHRSLLEWFLAHRGGRVDGYRKAIYSGVTTNHLAEVVRDIIAAHPHLTGVYHVASTPISKCDLLCLLRDAYNLDIAIYPVDGEICDRSMDGSKFRAAIGYTCPSWAVLTKQLAEDPTPYDDWFAASRDLTSGTLAGSAQ
jgi:dTDP-4-dehydrorhamnose reductase